MWPPLGVWTQNAALHGCHDTAQPQASMARTPLLTCLRNGMMRLTPHRRPPPYRADRGTITLCLRHRAFPVVLSSPIRPPIHTGTCTRTFPWEHTAPQQSIPRELPFTTSQPRLIHMDTLGQTRHCRRRRAPSEMCAIRAWIVSAICALTSWAVATRPSTDSSHIHLCRIPRPLSKTRILAGGLSFFTEEYRPTPNTVPKPTKRTSEI